LLAAERYRSDNSINDDQRGYNDSGQIDGSGKIIHYAGWADNSTGAFSPVKCFDAVPVVIEGSDTIKILER
jgi:hypothetical protein